MITTLTDVLTWAEDRSCAIGAFNTPNLETVQAVLGTAEQLGVPVIISHAQLHESISSLQTIGPVMLLMAKKAAVPVVVHLDHGKDLSYLEEALEMGFTSVMFDGSDLPFEENVSLTKQAVQLAGRYQAGCEGELGMLGGREGSDASTLVKNDYETDPLLARQFVQETGIDALAASFGTAHGFYLEKPKLNFQLIKDICAQTGKPLVMHGGSGVSPDDYRQAIQQGIRKINYYSYMSKAGVDHVRSLLTDKTVSYFHDVANAAVDGMREDITKVMRVFYGI